MHEEIDFSGKTLNRECCLSLTHCQLIWLVPHFLLRAAWHRRTLAPFSKRRLICSFVFFPDMRTIIAHIAISPDTLSKRKLIEFRELLYRSSGVARVFLASRASTHNSRTKQKSRTLQKSQFLIDIPFIWLNNLKFVQSRHFFYLKYSFSAHFAAPWALPKAAAPLPAPPPPPPPNPQPQETQNTKKN
jgi:hypothetical protein